MSDSSFGELIFRYTREDALRDGVLIDITQAANKCGFKLNTAISSNLYYHWRSDERQVRLETLLVEMLIRINVAMTGPYTDRIFTKVDGEDVVLHIGGGDSGEPVLTLCHLYDL